MRKRKNAFTLIELLAVIVILAIIALIATPIILGIVEDAKKDAFLRSVELLVGTTDIDIASKTFEEEYTYEITDGNVSNLEVSIKNTEGMNGSITYDVNGKEVYAIHNGVYCVIKTDNNTEVSDYEEGKCIIPPVLTESDISFITFNDLEYIYDGTEKEIVVNNLSDEFSVTYVNNKGINVGSYNATAIITGKNHRGSITKEATLTIQKASLTLKAEDKTSKQGEEIEELTYQVVSGTIYGNDELNINLTKEDGTEIGTYNIFVNADNINYEIILVNGIYTITVGFTSESCFAFSNGSITNYYDYESNDSSNKACPRDVIIPETIGGVTVTTIGTRAFESKNITSIEFSNSIKSIGYYAFQSNKLSGELDLSDLTNLTTIGGYAFSGNSTTNQITSIKLPSSLTTIGSYAFSGNKITNIELSSSVTSIGNYAFQSNKLSGKLDLSHLTNLTSINAAVFHGNEITSIKLPIGITGIGDSAFANNKLSGELDLSYLASLTTIGDSAFQGESDGSTNQITSIKFPSSVTIIGQNAFKHNKLSGELDLSILTNLTTIEYGAFEGKSDGTTNQITNIKLSNSTTTIRYRAFAHNAIDGELNLSTLTNLTNLKQESFCGNEITSIKLPSSVTYIDKGTFRSNKLSGELDLSNTGITSIGESAFCGSKNGNQITSVKFPVTLVSIGAEAFLGNALSGELDLSTLTNLTSIGKEAFGSTYSDTDNQITSVKFPNSLESIGEMAFESNKLSGELDLSNTKLTTINKYVFRFNKISSIKLPSTLTSIKVQAFRENPLTSVTFYGRSDLTGVTLDSEALGTFDTANITFIP